MPCFPFQTSTDPAVLCTFSPLNETPDGEYDLGRTPCKRENSHSILIHRSLDWSGFTNSVWSEALARGKVRQERFTSSSMSTMVCASSLGRASESPESFVRRWTPDSTAMMWGISRGSIPISASSETCARQLSHSCSLELELTLMWLGSRHSYPRTGGRAVWAKSGRPSNAGYPSHIPPQRRCAARPWAFES